MNKTIVENELMELTSLQLENKLNVNHVSENELKDNLMVNDLNDYEGLFFDVSLSCVLAYLKDADISDNEILKRVNSYYNNPIDFYFNIDNEMYYMVLEY